MISKKSSWRDYFLKGIGLILTFGLVLGLYPSLGLAQEKVKVVWSEWWDQEWGEENINWIISSFEKKHPNVNVAKIATPWPNMFDKIMSLCAAGESPDVMGMEVDWFLAFDRLGVIADLDTRLAKDQDFRAKLADSSLIGWKRKTKLIYWYAMSYHFAYDTDVFEEKGLVPPCSWDHLKWVLAKLKEPAKGKYGLALQLSLLSPQHIVLRTFHTPLVQFGGRLLDENGFPVFNSDAGVRVLKYWKSLMDEDLIYPGALETTEMTMYEMMAAGDLPLFLIGPWVQSTVQQSNPDIRLAYCRPWKDVTSGYVAAGSGISLSAQSEHQDIAWEFMKHLWSDEVALKMSKVTSMPFATKTVFAAPFIKEDPILRYQPDMIGDPASQPYSPVPEMLDLYRVLSENIQAFYLGQKTAKTALDDAAEYWRKVIQEYK